MTGDDDRLTWHGCVERAPVAGAGSGIHGRRLKAHDAPFHDAALRRVADLSAGMRLSLRTDSSSIGMQLVALDGSSSGPLRSGDGPARIDLTIDGRLVDSSCIPADGTVQLTTGANGIVEVELWLPHRCPVAVESLVVNEGAAVMRSASTRQIWVAHGSSITQSRFSDGPATSWTSQVARSLGLDLCNLGFAGECHLDPIVARMIASMPADVVSVCAGINAHTSISMSERVYRSNLAGFLAVVRDGHRGVPILVTSPIAAPGRETAPSHPRLLPSPLRRLLKTQTKRLPAGTVGPTLEELRDATADVVEKFATNGDANIHHLDGRALLSVSDAEHLVDGLHPDQNGEDLIAKRYLPVMSSLIHGLHVS